MATEESRCLVPLLLALPLSVLPEEEGVGLEENVGVGDLVSPSALTVLGLHRAPDAADAALFGVLPDEGGVGLAT